MAVLALILSNHLRLLPQIAVWPVGHCFNIGIVEAYCQAPRYAYAVR